MDLTRNGDQHVIITGGAGYIGSAFVGALLRRGVHITVIDNLRFGGESLLAYLQNPFFHFLSGDVSVPGVVAQAKEMAEKDGSPSPTQIVHLAAIVGFPACQAAGKEESWRTNVEAVKMAYSDALDMGLDRFILASTYSVYGVAERDVSVSEDDGLQPQSLYAETKVAAEEFLMENSQRTECAPLIFRFATLYGGSPRMRFDLMVNQFVLEAETKGKLVIYKRDVVRSFIHIRDVVSGLILGLSTPKKIISRQIFNLGSEGGNFTKDEVVNLVRQALPNTQVRYKDLTIKGDMRDVAVSYAKVRETLDFQPHWNVEQGIDEVLGMLRGGFFTDPYASRFRNSEFILQ